MKLARCLLCGEWFEQYSPSITHCDKCDEEMGGDDPPKKIPLDEHEPNE